MGVRTAATCVVGLYLYLVGKSPDDQDHRDDDTDTNSACESVCAMDRPGEKNHGYPSWMSMTGGSPREAAALVPDASGLIPALLNSSESIMAVLKIAESRPRVEFLLFS